MHGGDCRVRRVGRGDALHFARARSVRVRDRRVTLRRLVPLAVPDNHLRALQELTYVRARLERLSVDEIVVYAVRLPVARLSRRRVVLPAAETASAVPKAPPRSSRRIFRRGF